MFENEIKITYSNNEMNLYFLKIIENFKNDDFDYYKMCKKNIREFFKNNMYMKKQNYTLIKNDDILYIVVFNNNKFKIVSYEINENFDFVCFDVSYCELLYDLFSIIFN